MSCRMWRYSERWSWASWKEGRTSTRPCASSPASAAMRSSPASPWPASDRYDTADKAASVGCIIRSRDCQCWSFSCRLLRKIRRPSAWQRSGEDWSSWRWARQSIWVGPGNSAPTSTTCAARPGRPSTPGRPMSNTGWTKVSGHLVLVCLYPHFNHRNFPFGGTPSVSTAGTGGQCCQISWKKQATRSVEKPPERSHLALRGKKSPKQACWLIYTVTLRIY